MPGKGISRSETKVEERGEKKLRKKTAAKT